MLNAVFAGLILACCLILLLRLALPFKARGRLDAQAQRMFWRLRRVLEGASQAWRRRSSQRVAARAQAKQAQQRSQAEALALAAIQKARQPVDRSGNVYRPSAFKPRPGSPDAPGTAPADDEQPAEPKPGAAPRPGPEGPPPGGWLH